MKQICILLLMLLTFQPLSYAKGKKAFVILHISGYLLGMADTSATAHLQSCCNGYERNPLAPQNPTLRALEVTSVWGSITTFDYFLRKNNHSGWWILPSLGIAAHSYGLYTGIHPKITYSTNYLDK